jgi:hypothetical protein
MFALLNDYLVSNNRDPLGWLSLRLYEASLRKRGLKDIIEGNNPGCDTEGFFATEGWDPVRPAKIVPSFSASLIPSRIGHRPRLAEVYRSTITVDGFVKIPNTTQRHWQWWHEL